MRTRLFWPVLLLGSFFLLQTCVPVALENTIAPAYEPVAPEHAVAAVRTGNDPIRYRWHIEPVDQRAEPNIHTSLALDQNGWGHVSYHAMDYLEQGHLEYTQRAVSGWYIKTIERDEGAGLYSSARG